MARRLISLLVPLLICPGLLTGQDRPESPVFKDYDKDKSPRIFRRSTATYQMWKLFVVIRSANAGDPLAQHELGVRYLIGEGVTPDTVQAAYWIHRAAEKGVIPARYNMGILSYYGWGTAWNPFEAYSHFLYCAEQEMREAQYVLGQFLTDNLVVPRDYREAQKWLERAAEAEYEPARSMLKQFEREFSDSSVGQDSPARVIPDTSYGPVFIDFTEEKQAMPERSEWLSEILDTDDPRLHYAFGRKGQSRAGRKDSVDLATVMSSANAGSPEALVLLGRLFELGMELPQNDMSAAVQYLRALRLGSQSGYTFLLALAEDPQFLERMKADAQGDDPDALYVWAMLYYLGLDRLVENAPEQLTDQQALRFLVSAGGRGHLPSLIELGLCYFTGRWVGADENRAREYWMEADRLAREKAAATVSEGAIRVAMATVRRPAESAILKTAMETFRMGSAIGSLLADVAIAYCYENGIVVAPSKGDAARIYRRAAYRGSQDAYYALKRMHDELRPPGKEFEIIE